jgi:mannose-1-phosphate guanylyltransferase
MATPVFLLAAGLGTRLRPLTTFLPKPLLPVGDRPALEHILARVRPLGGAIVANAHHRIEDLRAFVLASAKDVLLSEEPHILGTAGGLAHAADLLGPGAVLVWNGDILSSLDALQLVRAHKEGRDAEATLAVKALPTGEGNVGVDAQGHIVRLRKETTSPGEVRGGAFLGIHMVGERLRERLPKEGCLVGDVYLPALREGKTLRVLEAPDASWHDIGTLRDYEMACFAWLEARGEGSFVGEGAKVSARVTLDGCILGRGARVEGEGRLERCIVWPNARVMAPCASSVVTPEAWAGVVPLTG